MTTSRRQFIGKMGGMAATAGAASMGCSVLSARKEGRSAKRPLNILLLMTDQHRYDAMGFMGNENVSTPTLDGIAARGTAFERAYCQSPVCTASRISMLMGRYNHSTNVLYHPLPSARHMVSFPQSMRAKGYATGCFGKLHVNGRDDLDWDVYRSKKDWPKPKVEPGMRILGGAIIGGDNPLGLPSPLPEESHWEWNAKEETLNFMEENRGNPWFIQCSFGKPHPAFQPPKRHWNTIDRAKIKIPRYPADDLEDVSPRRWERMVKQKIDKVTDEDVLDAMQGYYGNIAFCDELFGEVLAKLDELGLRENTLIVFTADHGEMLYSHRLWSKFCFFKESVRVPLIISLPGVVRSGFKTDALAELIDLYPTFMELQGFDTPDTVQGKSMVPLLTGATETHKDIVRSELRDGFAMQFDGRYKIVDNGPELKPELYDHENDPREINNLAEFPEQRKRVQRMLRELRKWGQTDLYP
ncbi:sulfatase [Candidatus Hydrogenedentota bacterium]